MNAAIGGRAIARSLRRTPAVTWSAVVCLALGLGATVAIASAVERVLLGALPFRDPERLVTVFRSTPLFDGGPHSAASFLDLARDARQVESLAAIAQGRRLLTGSGASAQLDALRVSGSLFPTLGVRPLAGRLLDPRDDADDQPEVAVLSAELWRARFGADRGVVGRTVLLDGAPVTVVGVVPDGLGIPHGSRVLRADVWVPLRWTPEARADRDSNYLMVLGRLAPRATVATATDELRRLFAGIVERHPRLVGQSVRAVGLREEGMRTVRGPLLLLFAAVLLVLLIACANVASLLLARGVERRREVAVRTALGGGRWAVVRPVLGEALVLALLGYCGGLVLGWVGVRTLGTLAASRLPQLAGLTLDLRVAGFAFLLALVVAGLCGGLPAWSAVRVDPQEALRSGRGGGTSRAHGRALVALVVGEVALSLMLLIGAGLVLRGFAGLVASDPGFDPKPLLRFDLATVPEPGGASPVRGVLEPALAAIRAVPGVAAAGAISLVPFENWGWNFNIRYEGQPASSDPSSRPLVETRTATPDFFAVTGQRLLAGRWLAETDDERPEAPQVVLVNRTLAERDFPAGDAVGKRFYTDAEETRLATIVGVVTDVRNVGPFAPPRAEIYSPYRQDGGSTTFPIVVRVASGDPLAVMPGVRAALQRVAPQAAVERVRSLSDVIAASLGRPRLFLSLLGLFAGVAMVLAMAGLFGVLTYAVAQRTRELGIRSALGSTPRDTVVLVARQGLRWVMTGLALGLVGSFALTRTLSALLYGVSPLDAPTWLLACVAFLLAGVAATTVPTLRAIRLDPIAALRVD